MMVSHIGPRAGCGCCLPGEVVACIVVLPMPVALLLVFLSLFEVDINLCGFGAICNILHYCQICVNSQHFPWILSTFLSA